MKAYVTFNLEFVPCWLKNTVVSTIVVFEQLDVQEPDNVTKGGESDFDIMSWQDRKKLVGSGVLCVCLFFSELCTPLGRNIIVPNKSPPGDDFSVAVIDRVPFEAQLLALDTAVSWQRREETH